MAIPISLGGIENEIVIFNRYFKGYTSQTSYRAKDVELGKVTKDKKMVKELTLVDCLRKKNTTY